MKLQQIRKARIFLLSALFITLLLVGAPLQVLAAMNSYCAIPPFVSTGTVQPNLLFLLDMSGSMAFFSTPSGAAPAVSASCNTGCCASTGYDSTQTYNGYFDPTKTYYCNSVDTSIASPLDNALCNTSNGDIWYEASGSTSGCALVNCSGAISTSPTNGTKKCVASANNCGDNYNLFGSHLTTTGTGGDRTTLGCTTSNPFYCCTNPPTNSHGDCAGATNGNCLNFRHMTRTDLMRWALTGGQPQGCSSNTFDPNYCDPELWSQTGNSTKVGAYCNNALDVNNDGTAEGGCILQASDGTLVANRWDRINSSIIKNLSTLPTQPRMGVGFFSASANALLGPKVYIGDYACTSNTLASCLYTSYSSSFKFKNLITYVNSQTAGGGTNTGPAMQQALNYFTNDPTQANQSYGFFPATEAGAAPTDKWRNPLYKCDYNSSGTFVCVPYPCATNFVLLLSDGGWNTPGCSNATSGADPVEAAYAMHHTGFTNPMSLNDAYDDKPTTVSAIYTVGMFMDGACVSNTDNSITLTKCNGVTACPAGYRCAGGPEALQNIAMYGSYTTTAATPGNASALPLPGVCKNDIADPGNSNIKRMYYVMGNCTSTDWKGSACTAIPSPSSVDWDKQGPAAGGMPDTYSGANDANTIKTTVQNAVLEIVARAASGAAASVLASANGSGANLVQSIFYPRRSISSQPLIGWTSTLQNFWYYLDPHTSNSTIRENTDDTTVGGVMELNLDKDRILNFDTSSGQTMARLYNVDATGAKVGTGVLVDPQKIESLWEAGLLLWNKDPGTRKIYTSLSNSSATSTTAFAGMTEFRADSTLNNLGVGSPTLQTLLNTDLATRTSGSNTNVAKNIVNYVRGWDNFCSSTVTQACAPKFCSGAMTQRCYTNADCSGGTTCNSSDTTVAACPGSETCVSSLTLSSPAETIYYRNRSTAIDLSGNGNVSDTSVAMPMGGTNWNEGSKVWKLGDIIDSTPKLESWIPLNTYDQTYHDATYTAFIHSPTYQNRGMVFTGANDGMLHAFKLGTLDLTQSGNIIAKLCQDDGTGSGSIANNGKCEVNEKNKSNLGTEQWGFIPNGALPYLQYLADLNYDYCHLYYVDGTPAIFDASIEAPGLPASGNYWQQPRTSSSWRTILIGSTRLGGGCNNSADAYQVQTPAAGIGYSSYFALDVTDPAAPQFLWNFSNSNIPALELATGGLGFSTTGPSIVKIKDRTSTGAVDVNDGKWFVVLASGPTGPIDSLNFKGFSDQPLKLFILDLKTGALLRTINTGIANAFGGSLTNAAMDYDFDYQDDAVYMGFTKAEDATLADDIWNKGGVIRLLTRKKLNGTNVSITTALGGNTALNPDKWEWSYLVNNIGPVTASISHLAHYSSIGKIPDIGYLYFGSGRYFYPFDDISTQQALYGVVEPCLTNMLTPANINNLLLPVCDDNSHGAATACSNSDTAPTKQIVDPSSCLKNATTTVPTLAPNGWFINLFNHVSTDTKYNERVITDPLAAQNGAVYFTSYSPDTDACTYGGESYLWAVKYDTAAAVGAGISGIGLLQVSTGAISEVKLGTDFGDKTDASHMYGRRTNAISGVPPTGQGLSIVVPPKPTNKMLHIRER